MYGPTDGKQERHMKIWGWQVEYTITCMGGKMWEGEATGSLVKIRRKYTNIREEKRDRLMKEGKMENSNEERLKKYVFPYQMQATKTVLTSEPCAGKLRKY